MTLKITIRMDSAAFDDGAEGVLEARDMLRKIVEAMGTSDVWDDHIGAIFDANGNSVGHIDVEGLPGRDMPFSGSAERKS